MAVLQIKRKLLKIFCDFYLIGNCTELENILFAKIFLSYVANIRLQNGSNIDHVQLETEVQQPFILNYHFLENVNSYHQKYISDGRGNG